MTMPRPKHLTPMDAHSASADPMPQQMKLILALLRRLQHGTLRLDFPAGASETFGHTGKLITLRMKNWKLASAVLKSGDIGFAETYIAGDWSCDDLPGLVELFIRNREAAEELIYGSWWGSLLYRARHLLNRNSKSGSRKNIHAHYDIGNAFYQLWLDPSMTYSSALYPRPGAALQEAQDAKYLRILDQLKIHRGANVLEIGCGWGGFAELAIRAKSAKITGLTLSTEQLDYAKTRLGNAGFAQLADLRLQDYRDIDGQFDAIASIEMFEAVGEQYWGSYFDCIRRNLKPGGRACVQSIVIEDALFERYRKGTDFIQQYIFPGGMLPSCAAFQRAAGKHGLKVVDEFLFGFDYARTLQEWRKSFRAALPQVRAQGFDEEFIRTWDFYLAYCEGGFRAGSVNVAHFTLEKT